jgi:TolB-like protein
MMNIFKRTGLYFIGILFLACSGSPAPVSAASPASADELDAAIRETSDYLNRQLPKGNKLVILNIQSGYPALSEYIIDELIANTVNDRIFSVVDRRQLDTIRAELNFQYSGEVDDDTMQELGRMAGAQIIISGAVSKIGDLYRLRIRALSVQTASIEGQFNRNIPEGTTIAALARSQATGYGEFGGRTSNPTTTPASGAVETSTSVPAVTAAPAPVQTPADPPTPTYKIGDTGPAGGLIFYDKGNNSGGWRYLEVSSKDAGTAEWGANYHLGGTGIAVGMGKQNTDIIMYYMRNSGESGRAAQLARQYSQGGYTDWFLPSRDEMNMIYTNLRLKLLGDFSMHWYWSSSEKDMPGSAWRFNLTDGGLNNNDGGASKRDRCLVRPIRAF